MPVSVSAVDNTDFLPALSIAVTPLRRLELAFVLLLVTEGGRSLRIRWGGALLFSLRSLSWGRDTLDEEGSSGSADRFDRDRLNAAMNLKAPGPRSGESGAGAVWC